MNEENCDLDFNRQIAQLKTYATCQNCGKLWYRGSFTLGRKPKFCSNKCRQKWYRDFKKDRESRGTAGRSRVTK